MKVETKTVYSVGDWNFDSAEKAAKFLPIAKFMDYYKSVWSNDKDPSGVLAAAADQHQYVISFMKAAIKEYEAVSPSLGDILSKAIEQKKNSVPDYHHLFISKGIGDEYYNPQTHASIYLNPYSYDELVDNVRMVYFDWGAKITAIKLFRTYTGIGLKEAKDFVESLT